MDTYLIYIIIARQHAKCIHSAILLRQIRSSVRLFKPPIVSKNGLSCRKTYVYLLARKSVHWGYDQWCGLRPVLGQDRSQTKNKKLS